LSTAGASGARLAGEERILDWEGALNARDTGGLPTGDGRRIRPGALVRSDVLTRLTSSGRRALIDHGVRTIVDVRSGEEVGRDREVYPFRDGSVGYTNVPFTYGRDERAWEDVKERYHAATTRAELNRIDLDAHPEGVARIVAAVADAPEGGVLVHCHAGKDRTGLVVALMLSLVGVSDDDIADDYALTALNLEPLIADWLQDMGGDEAERQRLRALAEPRREAMLDTLAHMREGHGSAEGYLLSAGVTREQVERLRVRLVEPEPNEDG
jgi:protein tyrosine/serine phosphatase